MFVAVFFLMQWALPAPETVPSRGDFHTGWESCLLGHRTGEEGGEGAKLFSPEEMEGSSLEEKSSRMQRRLPVS